MSWWLALAVMAFVGFIDIFALALCRIAKLSDE